MKSDIAISTVSWILLILVHLKKKLTKSNKFPTSPFSKDIDTEKETKQYRLKTVKDQIEAFLKAVRLKL